jgi:hypothetical protein
MINTDCPATVAQALKGGARGGGNGRRLLEAEIRRLGRQHTAAADAALAGSSGAGVLGEGAAAGAEHLLPRLKLRHVLAHRLDAPGDVPAHDARLRPAQPEAHQAHEVGPAGQQMPHIGTDAGCPNAYKHFVVPDDRQVDVVERQHVG